MENTEDINPPSLKKKKKKSKSRVKWRELLTNKLFDLLIVITGVTIAFQLNNLKLNSDQKSLERFYMESMLVDLKNDQNQIKEILASLKNDSKRISDYMNGVSSPDSLGLVLHEVFSFETFTPAQNTYQMLLASNGLTAFSNRVIRSQTAEYYNNYTDVNRFEDVYTRLLLQVVTYVNPYTDLINKKVLDPKLVSRPETKNFLLMCQGQLQDGIENHTELIQKGEELIKSIEDQLGK